MKKENFCGAEDLQIIIPYRQYEKLVEIATNYDALITRFTQLEKQCDALRGMYREALDRIGELSKYV